MTTRSQQTALTLTGVSRSTWHYRTRPRPRVEQPIPHAERAYPSRIPQSDEAVVIERIEAGWAAGTSIDHAFTAAWDQGLMLGSRRSWWRIGARIKDQSSRPVIPTRRSKPAPRATPVLEATGPNQVWSWDITDLKSPWRGCSFKAYSIIDINSRKLVGYRVEDREVDALAVEMFEAAIATHGAPKFVHADSVPAMRSNALHDFLVEGHGITMSHNRPRVSNDNPFSESEFKTMKYRPNYPQDSRPCRPLANTSTNTSPGTTSTTATPASRCSPQPAFTTAPGAPRGPSATPRHRPTTTPTPNASDNAPPHQDQPASSASTAPRSTPPDSTQIDNERQGRDGADRAPDAPRWVRSRGPHARGGAGTLAVLNGSGVT